MDENLRKQLTDIPALADFLQESEQVQTGTLACRIRDLLASVERHPRWYKAGMLPYALPGAAATIYVVAVPVPETESRAIKVVVEDESGGLHVAPELPPADDMLAGVVHTTIDEARAQLIANREACLSRIFPALMEVRNIVQASEAIKPRKKKRLCAEIAHACTHLRLSLESLKGED